MKRQFLVLAVSALLLSACGKKETPAPAPAAAASAPAVVAAPPEPKVLNIYNWPDYIPEGMIAAFKELKRDETTILLVEQNFRFAASLGDSVAVMDDGRIVHRGTMQELAADSTLQTRLLGLSLAAHQ